MCVFPTRTGMDGIPQGDRRTARCFSHTHRDGWIVFRPTTPKRAFFPHARGWMALGGAGCLMRHYWCGVKAQWLYVDFLRGWRRACTKVAWHLYGDATISLERNMSKAIVALATSSNTRRHHEVFPASAGMNRLSELAFATKRWQKRRIKSRKVNLFF